MRGTGRVIFAATLLLIVGVVNIIYGIGALDDANIFTDSHRFILSNLNTLGWVLIVLGIIQLAGGLSLMAGNTSAASSRSSVACSARSVRCSPSVTATRGGRWPCSPCACTSCTASSCSDRTRGPASPEPSRRRLLDIGACDAS